MNRTAFPIVTLLMSGAALAQPMPGAREEMRDRRELSGDRHEAHEDFHDLKVLEALRSEFEAARARRDMQALERIDHRVREQARREIADDKGDLRRYRAELHRDGHELRADERRLDRDVDEQRSMAAADDGREMHRDRHELREDARSAAAHRNELARHREILRELDGLAGRLDPEALNRKARLLNELVELARSEVHRDMHKVREDRRDLR